MRGHEKSVAFKITVFRDMDCCFSLFLVLRTRPTVGYVRKHLIEKYCRSTYVLVRQTLCDNIQTTLYMNYSFPSFLITKPYLQYSP
jgi:hypothetical protein